MVKRADLARKQLDFVLVDEESFWGGINRK
jgi:hypothetical protein